MPDETKFTAVCAHCGSEDVKGDAYATWNVDLQAWEIGGDVFEKGGQCHVCDGECLIEMLEQDPSDEWYLREAIALYVDTDRINVDDDAKTSRTEDGAWVQAWVFVPNPSTEDEDDDDDAQ